MAIEVLHRGKLPEEQSYKGSCSNCRSTVRCLKGDVKKHYPETQRDGPMATLDCPVCKHDMWVYPEERNTYPFPRD